MRRLLFLAGALLLLFSAPAFAQSDCAANACTNPSLAIFDASVDHNATSFGAPVVSNYTVDFWLAGATAPVQSTSVGKPTPDAQNLITVDLKTLSRPISLAGTYSIKVSAVGPGGTSSSPSSVPFKLAAAAPVAPPNPPRIR